VVIFIAVMTIRITLLSCLLAVVALAADVTGKWSAEVPGRGGNTQTMAINLKAEGNQLTGTVSGRRGDNPISDGKINGDDISFNVVLDFQGNSIKMIYTGKVAGDEIKFKREVEGRGSTEFIAKRSPAT
jgi:hypothetical protein